MPVSPKLAALLALCFVASNAFLPPAEATTYASPFLTEVWFPSPTEVEYRARFLGVVVRGEMTDLFISILLAAIDGPFQIETPRVPNGISSIPPQDRDVLWKITPSTSVIVKSCRAGWTQYPGKFTTGDRLGMWHVLLTSTPAQLDYGSGWRESEAVGSAGTLMLSGSPLDRHRIRVAPSVFVFRHLPTSDTGNHVLHLQLSPSYEGKNRAGRTIRYWPGGPHLAIRYVVER